MTQPEPQKSWLTEACVIAGIAMFVIFLVVRSIVPTPGCDQWQRRYDAALINMAISTDSQTTTAVEQLQNSRPEGCH
jgi:hypothetical protein